MSDLSIKINIANRVYPMTIKSEEEETVRKTAKMINEKIKDYESSYAVKDKQDLLAMCALEYGANNDAALKNWSDAESLIDQVRELNEQIKSAL
ncbi:MAG: cell division protein ZapA [Vicingaceae bacterium]